MPDRRALLLLSCLLSTGLACDEPTSSPASRGPTQGEASEADESVEPAEPEPQPRTEPVEPPPPTGGPSCDQRELTTDAGVPKRMCVDYSDHRGGAEPRCFEGVELSEGPCPVEGVVASCELQATGVVMRYYEGADLENAQRDCDAIRAKFDLNDSRRGG